MPRTRADMYRGMVTGTAWQGLRHNAGHAPLPKAGAERTLEAVSCTRLLGWARRGTEVSADVSPDHRPRGGAPPAGIGFSSAPGDVR
jgi:hypothetical protein